MKAALFSAFGDPRVLKLADAPDPHATPGTVRVRTHAAGVNPLDWMIRSGDLADRLSLAFPIIPGRDAAGVVDEVGFGVHGVAVGDRVFGVGGNTGTCAEHVVLTNWAPVPATWSLVEAAAAGLAVVTAAHALRAVRSGRDATVLIGGAAGSVGSAAVALAVDQGLRVIGTARESDHEYLRGLGAVSVGYGTGFVGRVAEVTSDDLVDIDTNGGAALEALVEIIGDPSRVVTVCDPDGAARLGAQMAWGQNDTSALLLAADLGLRRAYVPRIRRVFPLEEIAAAHELAQRGHVGGKVVVEIRRVSDSINSDTAHDAISDTATRGQRP